MRDAPCIVGELQRFLPRASPHALLRQLKALERDGLIERRVPSDGAQWGRYTLAPRGISLLGVVDRIAAWGEADLAEATNSKPG